jgi:hypothetical protein
MVAKQGIRARVETMVSTFLSSGVSHFIACNECQ